MILELFFSLSNLKGETDSEMVDSWHSKRYASVHYILTRCLLILAGSVESVSVCFFSISTVSKWMI